MEWVAIVRDPKRHQGNSMIQSARYNGCWVYARIRLPSGFLRCIISNNWYNQYTLTLITHIFILLSLYVQNLLIGWNHKYVIKPCILYNPSRQYRAEIIGSDFPDIFYAEAEFNGEVTLIYIPHPKMALTKAIFSYAYFFLNVFYVCG